jgi:hypothetical protein
VPVNQNQFQLFGHLSSQNGRPTAQQLYEQGLRGTQRPSGPLAGISGLQTPFNDNAWYSYQGGASTGAAFNAQIANQLGAPANSLQQAGLAAANDYRALKEAEDARYANASGALANAGSVINNLGSNASAIADKYVGDVPDVDTSMFDAFASSAKSYMDNSIKTINKAITDYQDYSNNLTQSTIRGEVAAMSGQIRMIESGINPDGSLMTPQQKEAARRGMQEDVRNRSATLRVQIAEQSQQALNNLKLQKASAQAAAGSLEAGLGQASIAFTQTQAQIDMFKANLGSNAELQALEAQAAGNMQLAQLYMQHQYSPVSMLSSVLAMAQLQQAGGGGIPAAVFG